MHELMKTNDPVLISYVESLLREAEIDFVVLDQNMSIMEGSIGVLPRRVMVGEDDFTRAQGVLQEAGLEKWETRT